MLRAAGEVIMAGKVFNVLFLCTHNSARSIMAEAFRHLSHRINIFTSLPLDRLDRLSLQQKLKEIGKSGSEEPQA